MGAGTILGERKFSPIDQRRFARLSGDFNPLHLDDVAARREIPGERVVYGIYLVLSALELLFARLDYEQYRLEYCSVRFLAPVYLRQPVLFRLISQESDEAAINLETRGTIAARLLFRCSPNEGSGHLFHLPTQQKFSKKPQERALSDLQAQRGRLSLVLDRDLARRLFPRVSEMPCAERLAFLLATTRLVGMECPGLRSIYSFLELQFSQPDPGSGGGWLDYRVEAISEVYRSVELALAGVGVAGSLTAFWRPPPIVQRRLRQVQEVVGPNQFSGQTAIIVGGSRGLGEVTAKIVGAGGGHPVITYWRGRQEAEDVSEELRKSGCPCTTLRCDVKRKGDLSAALASLDIVPTHLYYFASPKIFRTKAAPFDYELFLEFAQFYVEGFYSAYLACRKRAPSMLRVFYPSSAAVEEPVKELAEYAAAKSAGEVLCSYLARTDCQLEILVRRLPRIETDQTNSLLAAPAADGLSVMLGIMGDWQNSAIFGSATRGA